jgi:MoaA/NifB/PqqE/SkfB family radical SAM enzyme
MHVQRLITNETCNQNCWFCNARRPIEQPELVARRAVLHRIAQARATRPQEIVITGGEPSMRSDLVALVARCAEGGTRVVLETNAALVDAAKARALAAAGLAVARIQLVAWGPASDAITRDPGGFDAALRGMRALAEAGVSIEVATPVVRRTLALASRLPGEITAAELPVAALVLVIPTDAPDPSECAPLDAVADAVAAVADEARRVGLMVRIDAATYVPPCIFAKPERVAHLFALNRGNAARADFAHVPACAECLVRDRCPGFPLALLQHGLPPRLHPITEQRLSRRLTVVSTIADQIDRELVTRDEVRHGATGTLVEYTVRVNFHCNQACTFCFVSTHLPPPADAAVRAAIERAGREGAALVLSGGEPTLNPRLLEYVQLAKRAGVHAVELQSNAIRLADPALARALVAAGVERAMISLHGSTAAISDAITCAPGTFAATIRGIDRLMETPVRVRLNFVFCQGNYSDFPEFVDLVAAQWPRAAIVFSFVGSHTDVVPRTTALIPRFTDVLPSLLRGLHRARAVGVEVSGFDSMCGLPLCLVPPAEREAFTTTPVGTDGGGGEFVRGTACATCTEAYRCYGVRRGYAELYGTSELRALDEGSPRPAAHA